MAIDRQEQIKKLAKKCCYPCEMYSAVTHRCIGDTSPDKCCIAMATAENIISAGYGDLNEFVETIKTKFQYEDKANESCGLENDCESVGAYRAVDEALKEYTKK